MEKINSDKFQKLEPFKIDNLELIRGGYWISRTRELDSSEWTDHVARSYSRTPGGVWTETANNGPKDTGKYLLPGPSTQN